MYLTTLLCISDADDDHFEVRKELIPVASKWMSIGDALRLKPDDLETINNKGDTSTCLYLMVSEWLKKNYNVKKFGEPTWQRLVQAVGDPAGGANMGVAKKIAVRHKAKGMLRSQSTVPEALGIVNLFFNILKTVTYIKQVTVQKYTTRRQKKSCTVPNYSATVKSLILNFIFALLHSSCYM